MSNGINISRKVPISKDSLAAIEGLIERGVLKVSEAYSLVEVYEVGERQVRQHDAELRTFVNLNSPAGIRQAAGLQGYGS